MLRNYKTPVADLLGNLSRLTFGAFLGWSVFVLQILGAIVSRSLSRYCHYSIFHLLFRHAAASIERLHITKPIKVVPWYKKQVTWMHCILSYITSSISIQIYINSYANWAWRSFGLWMLETKYHLRLLFYHIQVYWYVTSPIIIWK